MSKQTSLSSFFKTPVVEKNNECANEKIEEERYEISRKKIKMSNNFTYKYFDTFINYGFISINVNGIDLPHLTCKCFFKTE